MVNQLVFPFLQDSFYDKEAYHKDPNLPSHSFSLVELYTRTISLSEQILGTEHCVKIFHFGVFLVHLDVSLSIMAMLIQAL